MESTSLVMFRMTINYEYENIWVKPVCDFFNLDVRNQYTKIKNDPILGKLVGKNQPESGKKEKLAGKNQPDLGEIDNNGRILLSRKGFLRWIQIINPNTIDKKLRDSFIIYQELISDYLFGAAEEQMLIGNLNARLQGMKMEYSQLGNEIRTTQQRLFMALNNRYQYSLPFAQQKKTIEIS
ncbi:MAG: hypothetical protein WCI54_15110 [Bacteroidia bacterium]